MRNFSLTVSIARIREASDWCESYGTQEKPSDIAAPGDTLVARIGKHYFSFHVLSGGMARVLYCTDTRPAICTKYQMTH